jgi:hypothetical protein
MGVRRLPVPPATPGLRRQPGGACAFDAGGSGAGGAMMQPSCPWARPPARALRGPSRARAPAPGVALAGRMRRTIPAARAPSLRRAGATPPQADRRGHVSRRRHLADKRGRGGGAAFDLRRRQWPVRGLKAGRPSLSSLASLPCLVVSLRLRMVGGRAYRWRYFPSPLCSLPSPHWERRPLDSAGGADIDCG